MPVLLTTMVAPLPRVRLPDAPFLSWPAVKVTVPLIVFPAFKVTPRELLIVKLGTPVAGNSVVVVVCAAVPA